MRSQSIPIDSTFTEDAEIYPFSPNDTIYGLSINGSILLNSDTSLVRVILVDENYDEFMVYEAYPMIVTDTAFDIVEECDETCYLDEISPHSIVVHLRDASISIDSLSLSRIYQDNLDQLQYQSKRNKDAEKINNMNSYIQEKGWNWWADSTNMVRKYYYQKRDYFGIKYNLLGIDYYLGGTYNNVILELISPSEELTLVPQFDWRKKHNAHIDSSPYWDHDPDIDEEGNGWMTGIRQQDDCSSCSAFGSIASFEAHINLYYNFHADYMNSLRLSEKDAFNCSRYSGVTVGCHCDVGKPVDDILDYFEDGVVNEECFPYNQPYCEGYSLPDCSSTSKCTNPGFLVKAVNYHTYDLSIRPTGMGRQEYLKRMLLTNSPLIIVVWKLYNQNVPHCVSLVGFDEDEDGNTVWIMKNSWGFDNVNPYPPNWQAINDRGYVTSGFELSHHDIYPYMDSLFYSVFEPDIEVSPLIQLNQSFDIQIFDHDKDGYYNWGIANYDYMFQNGWIAPCDTNKDSNDNNGRIGPYNNDFSGDTVAPEMNVYLGHPDFGGEKIDNNGFIYFTDSDLQNDKLTIYIENSGSAYINLDSDIPVTEVQDITGCFGLICTNLETQICFNPQNNYTTFDIDFDPSCQVLDDNPPLAVYKIDIDQVDEDVLEDFEFAVVYYNCGNTSGTYTIPANTYETWSDYKVVTKDVKIETGATLEITGNVEFTEESDIYVDGGAELLIDGGVLSGACDEYWNGIDVWGDGEYSQYDGHQGTVNIKNGGTIKEANCGIENRQYYDDGQGGYYLPTGGIIRSNGGIFKDNIIGVKFHPYQNFNPSTGDPANNLSKFKNTEFIITQDMYNQQLEPVAGVEMAYVEGIMFSGCDFRNIAEGTLQDPITNRGIGIYSGTAGFYVNKLCMSQITVPCSEYKSCTFEHLNYGILVLAERESLPILIDSAIFIDNKRGILMSGVNGADIIRNQFELNFTDSYHADTDTIVGIHLEASRDYVVEENVLNGNSGLQPTVGLHILNSGPYFNEVYNNSFAELYAGIVATGENRDAEGNGLCIKCNDFLNCENDVYVASRGGMISDHFGIAFFQGEPSISSDPTLAAGNTFSEDVGSSINYSNALDCGQIQYTYHGQNYSGKKIIPEPIFPPAPSTHITLNEDLNVEYTKILACPSNLGGGVDIPLEMGILATEAIAVTAYEDTLNMFVDGGDTDGLNFEVSTSLPPEAMQVRQELLSESPYLSDTVMKNAIIKEDVLPNAMIRDILVANPQSAKSQEVIQTLDQRFVPMPDYMMAEIMQGQSNFGSKELYEQSLIKHRQKKEKALSKLLKHYHSDTLNTSSSMDSLTMILQNENYPGGCYKLAMLYMNLDDSINTFTTLDNIPIEFNLTQEEQDIHDLYVDISDIQWDINYKLNNFDSLQILTLFDLMEHHSEKLPSIYARNMLINHGILAVDEIVYLPDVLKSEPVLPFKAIKQNKKSLLNVYPNPTNSYFIVEYNFLNVNDGKALLIFSDLSGKTFRTLQLKDSKNQVIIPTENCPNAVYILQLFVDNTLIESAKISIIK